MYKYILLIMIFFLVSSCCLPSYVENDIGTSGWEHTITKEKIVKEDCECANKAVERFVERGFGETKEDLEKKGEMYPALKFAFVKEIKEMDRCKRNYNADIDDLSLFFRIYGKCLYEKGYRFYTTSPYYCCQNEIECKAFKWYARWWEPFLFWYWFY